MDENMDLNKQDMNMNENQLNNFMEAVENMDLNKQVFEKDNELESDTEDVLQEFANPNAVIEEVTVMKETYALNMTVISPMNELLKGRDVVDVAVHKTERLEQTATFQISISKIEMSIDLCRLISVTMKQDSFERNLSGWEGLCIASLEDLALYDNESWNDPRDFAKPVKAISLHSYVPSTSDRRLIKLENQVQCLIEAHLSSTQPTQVNKITTSYEICSGPHDTQYCMKDPEQASVEYSSSRTDEVGEGLVFNFLASQDARLSKFETDFIQQQSKMTNKIDTVLKAITDRIGITLS
ncbi:hypothetical protein Tco_1457973 [Tanacetum coccineum]